MSYEHGIDVVIACQHCGKPKMITLKPGSQGCVYLAVHGDNANSCFKYFLYEIGDKPGVAKIMPIDQCGMREVEYHYDDGTR